MTATTVDARQRAFATITDAHVVAALSVLWLVASVLVFSGGDFTLNDDWAYAEMVRRFLETGQMRPTSWTFTPTISHVWVGALFCKVFGFSHGALRMSTLFMGWLELLFVFGAFRLLQAGRAIAAFAALVVAFNPVGYNLAHTFMTDVPFTAWCALALLGLAWYERSRRWAALGLALAAVILAASSRQPGIVIFGAVGLTVGIGWLKSPKWALIALVGLALCAAAGLVVILALPAQHLPVFINVLTRSLQKPNWHFFFIRNLLRTVVYTGIFLIPALPLLLSWKTWRERIVLVGAGVFAMFCLFAGAKLNLPPPFGPNVLHQGGLGPPMLHAAALRPSWPSGIWWSISGVGAATFALAIVALGEKQFRRPWQELRQDRVLWLPLTVFLAYIAPLSIRGGWFDRYLVPMLPFVLVLVLLRSVVHFEPRRLWASFALVGAFGLFTLAGTRDYLNHQLVREELIAVAKGQGATDSEIEAGFEFAGWNKYDDIDAGVLEWVKKNEPRMVRVADSYTLSKRAHDITKTPVGEWPHGHRYVVTFSPELAGYEVIDQRDNPLWLMRGAETLYLHRRLSEAAQ